MLYAFGSGSSRARERVVIATGWETESISIDLVAAPALYAAIRAVPAFAGSELNLEGAALAGDALWMFGRGNGARRGEMLPLNATCVLHWPAVRAHLRAPETTPMPELERVTRYDLGALGTTALGFTDAIALSHGFLYAGAAEASPDAGTDGPIAGSCVGVIGQDGTARWAPLLDPDGGLFPGKVEGIAWSSATRDRLSAVLDHDDPDTPSELCEIVLEGPWLSP